MTDSLIKCQNDKIFIKPSDEMREYEQVFTGLFGLGSGYLIHKGFSYYNI